MGHSKAANSFTDSTTWKITRSLRGLRRGNKRRPRKTEDRALEKAVGRADDPLAAAKAFVSRDQQPNERAEDFAIELKKLFKEAYPSEVVTSSVLLQRFMTGLRPAVSQQLLLRGTPKELSEAIEGATVVECALN